MKFLIDASLPRSVAEVLQRVKHEAVDVRDIGLGTAPDETIAAYAKRHSLCLVTRDWDFADIRQYPPKKYAGIVILVCPVHANRAKVLAMLRDLLKHRDIVRRLDGSLVIVEPQRIRVR